MIIALINYMRELSVFTNCHPVKLRHSPQYITTAQGGGFLRGNKGQDIRLTSLLRILNAFDMTLEEFFKEGFDENAE